MPDVFVSYKREDRPVARQVADAAGAFGLSVFFDAHIDVGERWDQRIEQELTGAGSVVVLWSQRSVNSDWVRLEARSGKSRGVLCPALIEDVAPPLEFSSFQCADLREWKGASDDSELRRLLSRSRVCAGVGAPRQSLPTDVTPFHNAFPKPKRSTLMAAKPDDVLASVPGDLDPNAAVVTILTATVLSGGEQGFQNEVEEWRALIHRSKSLRELSPDRLESILAGVRVQLESDFVFCVANAAKSLPREMIEPVFGNCALLLVADEVTHPDEVAFARLLGGLLQLEEGTFRRIFDDAKNLSRY